jgi:hypothetical protein
MYCKPLGWRHEIASLAYKKNNIWNVSRFWTGQTPTQHSQRLSNHYSLHAPAGYGWALLESSRFCAAPSYQLYLETPTLPEDSPQSTLSTLWAASAGLGVLSFKHTPTIGLGSPSSCPCSVNLCPQQAVHHNVLHKILDCQDVSVYK